MTIRVDDPNVESHPNGTVVSTAEKQVEKVPTQLQPNGKTNEKTTEDTTKRAAAANDTNVKPTADVVVPLDGGWGCEYNLEELFI